MQPHPGGTVAPGRRDASSGRRGVAASRPTVAPTPPCPGYLGAFLGDGFGASGAIQQVASELREALPELLRDCTLRQAWAYAYPRDAPSGKRSHPRGIDVHSDDADVSVNVWIAPDAANLNNQTGGLRIYEAKPPDDWSFETANRDLDAIGSLLGEDAPFYRVPYRENRAVVLNGHRFHQTDALDFAPGFLNHRINLTFLFGKRRRNGGCRI